MNSKYYLLTLCVSIITFARLKAQTCPNFLLGNITNGINAELIRTDNRLLLGIRVSWTWSSSVPAECFNSPIVDLTDSTKRIYFNRTFISISNHNNSIDYFNLDCYQMYRPTVRATLAGVQEFENGNTLFFGGSSMSSPTKLSRVCVGPSTLPEDMSQGRVNISWDPLPCHLQNGADISGYSIRYSLLPNSEPTTLSNRHYSFVCGQESGGPYSCRVAYSQFRPNRTYSFEVAAQNRYGAGSFSDPVTIESIPIPSSQGVACTDSKYSDRYVVDTTSTTSEDADYSVVAISTIVASSSTTTVLIKDCSDCTRQEGWTLMGSLVAVILVSAGIVIVVQFIINLVLWTRLRSIKKDQTLILPQTSTLHEKIDMKECSAYGQVTSPQTMAEQPHIYESTT